MRKLLFACALVLHVLILAAQTEVTTAAINLRDAPNGNVLSVVPRGAQLEIGECEAGWCPTDYNGQHGYVSKAYLKDPQGQQIQTNGSQAQSPVHYYTNSDGNRIQAPTKYSSVPAGATAKCADGTYSFSAHRRGTCSHHGGVVKWY